MNVEYRGQCLHHAFTLDVRDVIFVAVSPPVSYMFLTFDTAKAARYIPFIFA